MKNPTDSGHLGTGVCSSFVFAADNIMASRLVLNLRAQKRASDDDPVSTTTSRGSSSDSSGSPGFTFAARLREAGKLTPPPRRDRGNVGMKEERIAFRNLGAQKPRAGGDCLDETLSSLPRVGDDDLESKGKTSVGHVTSEGIVDLDAAADHGIEETKYVVPSL